MVTFGLHLDTASIPFEQAVTAMKASKADWHLIMADPNGFFFGAGDVATIRKYLEALPNAKFIWRCYHRFEGNWKMYPSALEYERHWHDLRNQLGDTLIKRIVFDDPVNEPNLAGADPIAAKAYVNRCMEMVQAASNAGVKLAVGAWSVGTPHESLLTSVYVPLWTLCGRLKQGISAHYYGAIPNEAGELAPLETVLDASRARAVMASEKWPIVYGGWLIARGFRIIHYCEQNRIPVPDIYITECFVDNVFNSTNSQIKEAWKRKYATPMFPDPRGVQAWGKFLKEMFPELPFDKAIATLLSHARKKIFYHPAFKAAILFAMNKQWGYPSGTNKEAGSDYSHPQFDHFRANLLAEVNTEAMTTPIPSPSKTLVPVKIRSNATATNIRTSASASSAKLGAISPEWVDALASENWNETGLQWVQIDYKAIQGFASRLYVEIEARIIIPPPPAPDVYAVEFENFSFRGSREEVAAREDMLKKLFERILDNFQNPIKVE